MEAGRDVEAVNFRMGEWKSCYRQRTDTRKQRNTDSGPLFTRLHSGEHRSLDFKSSDVFGRAVKLSKAATALIHSMGIGPRLDLRKPFNDSYRKTKEIKTVLPLKFRVSLWEKKNKQIKTILF